MNKLLKGLSTATLATVCLLGTGCGKEEAKKIDVEDNYETVNTAALSVNTITEGEEGFFIKTEMVVKSSASSQGVSMDMEFKGTTIANHVGENYYLLTSGDLFVGESGQAINENDGVFTGYMWSITENPFTEEVEEDYSKTTIAPEDISLYTQEFELGDDIGFLSVFQGTYAEFEANVEDAIAGLKDQDLVSEFIDIETMLESAEYKVKATELDGVKTFTIVVTMEDKTEGSALEVSYAVSVKDDKVSKIKTVVDVDMVTEGVPSSAKVTVTQTFGYEGKSDSKYTTIPAAEKFN